MQSIHIALIVWVSRLSISLYRCQGMCMLKVAQNIYALLIIPEMWRQLVKYKEAFCLVLNRNKNPFTNWRHASGIINKVYKSQVFFWATFHPGEHFIMHLRRHQDERESLRTRFSISLYFDDLPSPPLLPGWVAREKWKNLLFIYFYFQCFLLVCFNRHFLT